MGHGVAGSRMNVGGSRTFFISGGWCPLKVHLRSRNWHTRIATSDSPGGHIKNANSWTTFPKILIQKMWNTAQESDFEKFLGDSDV